MARMTVKERKTKELFWQEYLKECQEEFDKEKKMKEEGK
jgi:hypothetical protein